VGEMVDLELSTVHSCTHLASVCQSLSYSVHAHCLLLHFHILRTNSIVLTDRVTVMVRIVQKSYGCFWLGQYTQADRGTWLAFSTLEDGRIK
jgi:hypothetical protein